MAVQPRGLMDSRLGRGSLLAVPLFLLLGTLALLISSGEGSLARLPEILRKDARAGVVNHLGPWRATLEGVMSPETADAIERDRQLRRSIGAAVDFTRSLTRDLAERFELPSLMEASDSLALARRSLDDDSGTKGTATTPSAPQKRQGRPGIPGLTAPFTGKRASSKTGDAAASSNPLADLGNAALDAILSPLKDALSGITNGITKNLGGAAMFLGLGIGTGTAQGLNLAPADALNKLAAKIATDNGQQPTGLNPAIQSLGQGASAAIVGALNVTGKSSVLGSFNISSLLGGQALSEVALKFADGLGAGAVSGLKLGGQNKQAAAPPAGSRASDVAGAFGFGLSNSLARSVDLSGGLSNSLARSVDLSGLRKVFPGLNAGSVAQGFARGLLQGAGDSIEAMGGLKALMNGTAHMPKATPNSTINFNDTLGGASSGFGQGIGGQGVLVATQLIAEAFPNVVNVNGTGQTSKVAIRSLDVVLPRQAAGADNNQQVTIGFGPALNLSAIINTATVSRALQTIIDLLQCEGVGGLLLIRKGLTKSGAFPSSKSLTSDNTLGANITSAIRDLIPNGTISFVSGGNRFEIDGRKLLGALEGSLFANGDGIWINGHNINTFAALMIVHVLVALLVFVAVLPLAMGLEGAQRILARAQLDQVLPQKTPRWVGILWLFVAAPSLFLVVLFGALLAGNKPEGHFRTAHSVIGLVAVILVIPATALYYADSRRPELKARIVRAPARGDRAKAETRFILLRALSNQLFQTLGAVAILTGFGDLAGEVLCYTAIFPIEVYVSIGFAIASISNVGQLLAWLDFYIAWRTSRSKSKNATNGGEEGGQEATRGKPPSVVSADDYYHDARPAPQSHPGHAVPLPHRPIREMKVLYERT